MRPASFRKEFEAAGLAHLLTIPGATVQQHRARDNSLHHVYHCDLKGAGAAPVVLDLAAFLSSDQLCKVCLKELTLWSGSARYSMLFQIACLLRAVRLSEADLDARAELTSQQLSSREHRLSTAISRLENWSRAGRPGDESPEFPAAIQATLDRARATTERILQQQRSQRCRDEISETFASPFASFGVTSLAVLALTGTVATKYSHLLNPFVVGTTLGGRHTVALAPRHVAQHLAWLAGPYQGSAPVMFEACGNEEVLREALVDALVEGADLDAVYHLVTPPF